MNDNSSTSKRTSWIVLRAQSELLDMLEELEETKVIRLDDDSALAKMYRELIEQTRAA